MTSATAEMVSHSFNETPARQEEVKNSTLTFKNPAAVDTGSKSFIKKPTIKEPKVSKQQTIKPKQGLKPPGKEDEILLTENSESTPSAKR